jgi:hypothetical protein
MLTHLRPCGKLPPRPTARNALALNGFSARPGFRERVIAEEFDNSREEAALDLMSIRSSSTLRTIAAPMRIPSEDCSVMGPRRVAATSAVACQSRSLSRTTQARVSRGKCAIPTAVERQP